MALSSTVGSYTDFGYTGGIQQITIPEKGVYRLECWGAGGGGTGGGTGGYASGYKLLDKGTVVYVCVGQAGSGSAWGSRYNGGTDDSGQSNPAYWYGKATGGGATHMSSKSGLLTNSYGSAYIVAGAGGGGDAGGNGGGASGGAGNSGSTATQTSGYARGKGQGAYTNSDGSYNGGGGGWYGGYRGSTGGGGGSGYIGGVPSFTYLGTTYAPTNTAGSGSAKNANGKARITLVRRAALPIVSNVANDGIEKLTYLGNEVKSLIVDGVTIFMRRWSECLKQARAVS